MMSHLLPPSRELPQSVSTMKNGDGGVWIVMLLIVVLWESLIALISCVELVLPTWTFPKFTLSGLSESMAVFASAGAADALSNNSENVRPVSHREIDVERISEFPP